MFLIRVNESEKAKILLEIPYKAKVQILNYAFIDLGANLNGFDYAKIKYNNMTGWVWKHSVTEFQILNKIADNLF